MWSCRGNRDLGKEVGEPISNSFGQRTLSTSAVNYTPTSSCHSRETWEQGKELREMLGAASEAKG